jgi:sugar phosphate isomerase/epimerase
MITRREFGRLALASLASSRALLAAGIDSRVAGVRIGVQSYSFRGMARPAGAGDSVDGVIAAMVECGLGDVELFAPDVEPRRSREELRAWRLESPLEHFREVKRKFDKAGITIYAYNYSPNTTFTDGEIDRGFDIARALGAEIITSSTTLDVAKRIAPFAEKHKMIVALHGHSAVDKPGEIASPESFAEGMKLSKYFRVNLDIGHFTAANFDAMQYLRQHHDEITNLHLKDRRHNQGDNVPWGTGDTPIRDVLQLLKRERWPIRAYIEYEHKGAGTPVEEVKKCYAFVKDALA